MKIYVDMAIEFRAAAMTQTSFMISFNWITETGVTAGAIDKVVGVGSVPTINGINEAVKDVVKATINASGLYTVAKNDIVILFGGVDSIGHF